jgi:hypothetical protein
MDAELNQQGFIENLNLEPKNYGVLKQYANRIISYSKSNEVKNKTKKKELIS